ncbi:MAG: hydrolase [Beggiatoa sp. IS2]|nr:MAG: hydrolase [Beggiatoa sp. IS2]
MLIEPAHSCLLIIDVQEKLIKAISESQQVLENCAWLIQLAQTLNIPLLVSEQYPQGLGPTVLSLRPLFNPEVLMEKVHFSCVAEEHCKARLESLQRRQVIIGGIESHVCVLQTAIDLLKMGKEVFIVADAVSSRRLSDKELALARLRDVGIHIVSKEMVFFEWLHQAATPLFKQLSKQFL